MKKWLVALTVALCLAVPFVGAQDAQAATVAKGKCGSSVSWTLTSNGNLTISGSGKMKAYSVRNMGWSYYNTKYPWYEYANKIKKVTIKSGVTSVAKGAFASCSKVKSVSISGTVKKIGLCAFACTNIKTFKVASGNKYFSASGGVLFNKKKTKLIAYGGGLKKKSYTVPSSVTTIGAHAFDGGAYSFKKVVLTSKVKSVGSAAFGQCCVETIVCKGCKPKFADDALDNGYYGITVKYK